MIRNKYGHTEPLVFEKGSRSFFTAHLDALVERCLDFKERKPFTSDAGRPFELDVEAVVRASQVKDEGEELESILGQFGDALLDQSLNFGAPSFLAHPDNAISLAGVLGDFARSMMHQNLVSYEYSPAATYAEFALLLQLRRLLGYAVAEESESVMSHADSDSFGQFVLGSGQNSLERGFDVGSVGGAFIFGGTGANFVGMLAAREQLKRQLAERGEIYDPRRVRILTKVPYAHYSLRRGAQLLGLGNYDLTVEQLADTGLSKDVRVDVASDNYRIDVADLERKIEATLDRGEHVLCVFALAGDSRMVSFDDLAAVCRVAQKYDIWVHADGCEGGQCLLSPNRRHLLNGVENVDSFSMDPHKVLMIPYNLSVFLLRNPDHMGLIDIGTSLVRLGSLSYGTYTPGVGSKDFAALRLWFLLKHWGWKRLAEEMDRRHELALKAARLVELAPELRLINPAVEHNAVAFVYCPDGYLSEGRTVAGLNALNRKLHHRLNSETQFYVHRMDTKDDARVVSSEKESITILRMMFGNPLTDIATVEACLRKVIVIGRECFQADAESPSI